MENEQIQIKKILRKIYQINYDKIDLRDNDEFILQTNGVSEFTQMLKKIDTDNGIIVTPSGYKSGLFFSLDNDGEIYASSKYLPDIVNFSLNLFGLKKNYFYKITILARDTDRNTTITDDRRIVVVDDSRQIVMEKDLTGYDKNQECIGFFRALSNEVNLNFEFGKVVIKDIIIDEVILAEEKLNAEEEQELTEEIQGDKLSLVMYGIFGLNASCPPEFKGKYIEVSRFSGRGLQIFYNRIDKTYTLEKSNIENLDNEPFTNLKYMVDLNCDKLLNKNIFDYYKIINVSTDISPNTLKQGYIEFAFIKNGANVEYTDVNGRLYTTVSKFN